MKRFVKSESIMTDEDRLFLLVALSANQKAGTLFVATKISGVTSDWSTFKVCILISCRIWDD